MYYMYYKNIISIDIRWSNFFQSELMKKNALLPTDETAPNFGMDVMNKNV